MGVLNVMSMLIFLVVLHECFICIVGSPSPIKRGKTFPVLLNKLPFDMYSSFTKFRCSFYVSMS